MSGNAAAVLTKPAFRKIEWLKRDIAVERRPDGVIVLQVADSAAGLREAHPGLAGEMGRAGARAHLAGAARRRPSGNGASCPMAKPSARSMR